jgi:uncharacterized protein DUF4412
MAFRMQFVAAALLASALPAAAEDLTIVSKMTRNGGEPTTATSYLSTDHARMVQPDGGEAILDLKTGQITVIDTRKKEYYVVTRQDMDQMMAKLQQTMNSPEMQKAKEQMKNLPPDVQKRMQGMMGGASSSVEVKKTGTTRKVAGYNCDNWTITAGPMKTEHCVTTEIALPAQTWDTYRDFAEKMRSMMASMGPLAQGAGDMAAKMKEMRGFPVATSTSMTIMGRTSSSSNEVVEVKKGAIPASAWEVPAGYKKVDNPMLKGMGSH